VDYALYLLGPPILKSNALPVDIGRRKALAMLSYLVVTGQSHSRDALAALFWPNHGQSRARANLRRSLYDLNQNLSKGLIVAERETVSLRTDGDFWVDIQQFRRLLATCRFHDHRAEETCSECLPILSEAAEMYLINSR